MGDPPRHRPDHREGGGDGAAGAGDATTKPDHGGGDPSAEKGYQAMTAQGLRHGDIVQELARRVLGTLDELDQVKQDRHGDKKGFI